MLLKLIFFYFKMNYSCRPKVFKLVPNIGQKEDTLDAKKIFSTQYSNIIFVTKKHVENDMYS